jgi:predicted AlkP superfamily pyrophosphatase or phosphodiesterase
MRKLKISFFLFTFLFFILSCSQKSQLVILISIDQMRADYFTRYENAFTGGLGRLYREGLVFTNADLNYAASETGPGHATLATGSYPGTNGILANEWVDPKSRQPLYCVQDSTAKMVDGEGGGCSPSHLAVTAFGDWLKAASPSSKVISVAVKDRAAILMGGKHPDYAFWYDRQLGHLVTSNYYLQSLPQWVKNFNASNWIDKNLPAAWSKLMPESTYANNGPDEMAGEFKWGEDSSFPHSFLSEKKKEQIVSSPWGDMLILDLAIEAIRAEKLGKRGSTDFLAVGLSCTDYVGHAFGPDSHEMHDHLLRLDRALGTFLQGVETQVGKGKFLVVLSADHAVFPLPEFLSQIKKENARRIIFEDEIKPRIATLSEKLRKEIGVNEPIIQSGAFLNYAAAAKQGIDSLSLENKVREGLLKIDGIADVYFRRELLNKNSPDRPYLGHFQRSYFSARGEDFQIRFCENCLITYQPTGTTHGSPYRYDTHVPMIFWGDGIQAAKVDRAVYTVDIAPTLARRLGLSYPATVNGVPLNEIVK